MVMAVLVLTVYGAPDLMEHSDRCNGTHNKHGSKNIEYLKCENILINMKIN
jgi:hypothetical protein